MMSSSARAMRTFRLLVLLWGLPALAGCGASRPEAGGAAPAALTAWFHSGREAERTTIQEQVRAFNAETTGPQIHLTLIPEGSYNAQVQAAALAGELPDLLEFDGPFVYNYVWAGQLRPIGSLLTSATKAQLLPSIIEQGTYRGRLYTVGTFDSGLALFARRSMLRSVGARIPTGPADAWSADEFDAILEKLAERDPDGAVLDLKLNYTGEWFTFAFSPVIESAGGDLIDRKTYQTAEGFLNGAAAVGAMRRVQRWIRSGRVDANLDDAAFTEGRVALSWVGHWEYPRYHEAFGDDLALVPLPDFGNGTRTGQGSWNWGVTRRCRDPQAAVRFLEFLLRKQQVLAMADANGAVPATRAAVAASPLVGPGGPLRLYVEQLTGGHAVPRPRTPAYPVITVVFQKAFDDIRHGADVQQALDRAAAAIDRDIRDNEGYRDVTTMEEAGE